MHSLLTIPKKLVLWNIEVRYSNDLYPDTAKIEMFDFEDFIRWNNSLESIIFVSLLLIFFFKCLIFVLSLIETNLGF